MVVQNHQPALHEISYESKQGIYPMHFPKITCSIFEIIYDLSDCNG